jgi:nitrogen fixation NifU-like protein
MTKKKSKVTEDVEISAKVAASVDRSEIASGPLTDEEEIYKENILDHYRNPHNVGDMKDATFCNEENNPICGDTLELLVKLDKSGHVADVKFHGSGCAISQASVSMLTDLMKGKTLDELKKMTRDDVLKMLGIPIGVVRMKCALLSLRTLQRGIERFESGECKVNNHGKQACCK